MNTMKKFSLFIALLAATVLVSCTDDAAPQFGAEDLIAQIEGANLETVTTDALPALTQSTLDQDYAEFAVTRAQMAPDAGFVVSMEDLTDMNETRAFFDMNGEELTSEGNGPGHARGPRGKRGKRPRAKCFDLVYPVDFTLPDGSSVTLNSVEDREQIKAWYDANPEAEGRPELVFPVEVTYEDGTVVAVADLAELKDPKQACRPERIRCFEMVYPYDLAMPDGSTVTLNSREDHELVRAWYAANPEAEGRPELVYPITIVYADGSTATATSAEELQAFRDGCTVEE